MSEKVFTEQNETNVIIHKVLNSTELYFLDEKSVVTSIQEAQKEFFPGTYYVCEIRLPFCVEDSQRADEQHFIEQMFKNNLKDIILKFVKLFSVNF